MERDGKYYFVLDEFLQGARRTASEIDSTLMVRDRETGRNVGGVGIIMARLIDIVENYRDGNGDRYKSPIEI